MDSKPERTGSDARRAPGEVRGNAAIASQRGRTVSHAGIPIVEEDWPNEASFPTRRRILARRTNPGHRPPVPGLRRATAVTDLERMVPYQGPVTCEECGNLIHPLGWDAHTRNCPAVIDRIVAAETADLDERLMIWLRNGCP